MANTLLGKLAPELSLVHTVVLGMYQVGKMFLGLEITESVFRLLDPTALYQACQQAPSLGTHDHFWHSCDISDHLRLLLLDALVSIKPRLLGSLGDCVREPRHSEHAGSN